MTTEDVQPKKSLVPHITIAALAVVVLVVVFLWPKEEPAPAPQPLVTPEVITAEPEPDESEPEPEAAFEDPYAHDDSAAEPEPQPEPEPEPLDTSDAAVKSELLSLSDDDQTGRLLVNEGLLSRFVVSVSNIADDELAVNHNLMTPPEQHFRVYTQAGKEWIDPASYKRYTPYVDALESIDSAKLVELYKLYKPAISDIFMQIGDPDTDFDSVLVDAIDHLLDTPEVPVPVEVYTDSVMFKYRDSRLESLSQPQKQLLRTGPENMRRIKAKLRALKDAL